MKVVVWNGAGYPRRYVTGVGKHVRHMAGGLSERPGWDVRLLIARDDAQNTVGRRAESPLGRLAPVPLPFARRTAEVLWRTVAWPSSERWAADADWVYCPRELYVPVRGAGYAVTVHDLYCCEPECPETGMRHRLARRLVLERAFASATVLLAVSQFTKGRLVELFGVDPARVRVVGNGVEPAFFDMLARDPEEVSPFRGTPYLLSVGGLTRKKGAAALLALADALGRVAPEAMLVVAGPVEAAFCPAVEAARNVRVLARGFPDEDMHALVRGAAAMVMLSEYEGFGIPVIEAMAAGVPVIAARRASLPEVVGEAGVLVEPTRPREIAEIARDILVDAGVRGMLIAKGRARAATFTWNACVKRLAAALTESRPSSVGLQDVA